MVSGIYQIENQINGNRYIGSAVNLQQRWATHLSTLRRKHHDNSHLQRAFNKYGEEIFVFSILEQIEDPTQLIPREQYYFDTQNPEYNISPTAGSSLGVRHTDETYARMSAAKTGKRNPNYGKRPSNYGKHPSAETVAKMHAAMTGKHHSAETRAKMHAAMAGERNHRYGKRPSAKTRAKISVAMIGKRNHNYGKHPSEETLSKMRAAKTGERHPLYGKHHSAETKRKMHIAQRARRQRERELKEE